MKKLLYTFMVSALTAATLSLFSACADSKEPDSSPDGGGKTAVVSGFDVAETATAEVGSYYSIPVPEVSVSEGTFDLSISAKKGEEGLFVVNNQVLITDFAPHVVTYTLSYLGGEQTKSTTVTPQDTTAPVIKFFGLENTLYSNSTYDVSKVVADDNSFEKLSVQMKAVYVETGDVLTISNNQFTTPNASGVTVRLEASATDSNGNAVTKTKDLYVVDRNSYGTLDTLDSADVSRYINTHGGTESRTQITSASSLDENEIEGIRGRALKIQHNEFNYGSKEASFIKMNTKNLVGATAFDYLTFRMYVDAGTAVTDGKSTVSIGLKESTAAGIGNGRANGWIEYTVEKKDYPQNGEFTFQMAHWCGKDTLANFTVYIDEVTGGYNKKIYLGESVNMLEGLGLDETEVTDMQLQTTVGATLEEGVFECTQAGEYTVRVTVDKDPYKETTFDYVIKVITHSTYEDFLGLGEDETSKYTVLNRKSDGTTNVSAEITKSIVDGTVIGVDGKVLRLETGETVQNGTFIFEMPSIVNGQMNSFDYYTIVGYVDCARDGFRISAISNGVEVVASERLQNVKGRFEYKIKKEYFGEYLQFIFADWTGTASNQAKCLYIASITGGYNEVGLGTELNLLTKTGLTATELEGTYFKNARGVQTVIPDLSAFTPTEVGEIVLVVSKEGFNDSVVAISIIDPTDLLRVAANDVTKYTVLNAGGSVSAEITKSIVDGTAIGVDGMVLRLETGETAQNGTFIFNIPSFTSAELDEFDYYTIVGYVDCARNGFRISAISNGVEVAEGERLLNVKGRFEYRVDKQYFGEYLQFIFADWTGTASDQAKCLYIASITGGYNA